MEQPKAICELQETFRITGRGLVFVVKVIEGTFLTNDFMEFNFNGRDIKRKIIGIDRGSNPNNDKRFVGILVQCFNSEEIDDLWNWNPNHTIGKIY